MRFEGLSLQMQTGLLRAPSGLARALIGYFVRSALIFERGVIPAVEDQRRSLYFSPALSKYHGASRRKQWRAGVRFLDSGSTW